MASEACFAADVTERKTDHRRTEPRRKPDQDSFSARRGVACDAGREHWRDKTNTNDAVDRLASFVFVLSRLCRRSAPRRALRLCASVPLWLIHSACSPFAATVGSVP